MIIIIEYCFNFDLLSAGAGRITDLGKITLKMILHQIKIIFLKTILYQN
jgi:hypothetical protein